MKLFFLILRSYVYTKTTLFATGKPNRGKKIFFFSFLNVYWFNLYILFLWLVGMSVDGMLIDGALYIMKERILRNFQFSLITQIVTISKN